MSLPKRAPTSVAFSLVEVVMALGITSFALMAMLGLFTTGLKSSTESEKQMQAANLASLMLSRRQVAPTNSISNPAGKSFALPPLNVAYGKAYNNGNTLTNYVDTGGFITTADKAAFTITCQIGTTPITGDKVAQVYMMLTWPPRADPAGTQVGRYELTSFIPLP